MKNLLTITLSILICSTIYSQKEANIWYFGAQAGIDFNPTVPVPLLDGQMSPNEGCASIADDNGDLLFYTDGISVWNKNHTIMPNGTGLMGNSSSTQSGVIVPWPNSNDTLFFVFTVAQQASPNGFRYSVVNMNLDVAGDVILSTKNTLIETPTTEKVTAVRHANGQDIWVITHRWNSNEFAAYLVTPAGFNNTPVVTGVGSVHTGTSNNTIGYLRGSPDGSMLALAVDHQGDFIEIFDFDNSTGIVSDPILISNVNNPYGVEFSPNGERLYVGTEENPHALYQIDVSLSTSAQVIASMTKIDSSADFLGGIQLGPDGKIYCARFLSDHLAVINDPNQLGTACNYVQDGFHLGGKMSRFGLPNFITTYFSQPTSSFSSDYYCLGDTTCFWYTGAEGEYDSLVWYFGDPSSGPLDTAFTDTACHYYGVDGNYDVTLIVFDSIFSDTSTQTITIYPQPVAALGNDTIVCNGQFTIGAGNQGSTYTWNTGDTTQTITIVTSGQYWVQVDNGPCPAADTINVTFTQPYLEIGPDTTLCEGEVLTLTSSMANSYFWNTTETTQSITVDQQGEYFVVVNDTNGCQDADTLNVAYSILNVELGPDQYKCAGESVLLDAGSGAMNYSWNSGETTQQNWVGTPSIYIVTIDDGGRCSKSDTVTIFKGETPFAQIEQEPGLCKELILYVADKPGLTYSWSTGETEPSITVTEDGTYAIEIDNGECPNRDTVSVEVDYIEPETLIPNVFTPNNDTYNDLLEFKVPETEAYELKVYNRWGNLVFETADPKRKWGGDENPAGVYSYILVYTKLCGDRATITKEGYVTLLR